MSFQTQQNGHPNNSCFHFASIWFHCSLALPWLHKIDPGFQMENFGTKKSLNFAYKRVQHSSYHT